jgi:hypothetical protein
MKMDKGTLSYLGFKVYKSKHGVAPVVADELTNWESKTATKITVRTVENNRVDGDGYVRNTGLLRSIDAMDLKFWKDKLDIYTDLKAQAQDVSTSSDDIYVDFTFICPKGTEFATAKDYTLPCIVTCFSEDAADGENAQSFTITILPSGKPVEFTGPVGAGA